MSNVVQLYPRHISPPPTPAAIHGSAPLPTLVRRAAHAHEVAALRAELQRARRALATYRSKSRQNLLALRIHTLEADLRGLLSGRTAGGAA